MENGAEVVARAERGASRGMAGPGRERALVFNWRVRPNMKAQPCGAGTLSAGLKKRATVRWEP